MDIVRRYRGMGGRGGYVEGALQCYVPVYVKGTV